MEQNNIEDLIRSVTEKKRIEPSPEVRLRLEDALNSVTTKKNRLWVRYAIAAVLILGLFLAGNRFINPKATSQKQKDVVNYKDSINQELEEKPLVARENRMVVKNNTEQEMPKKSTQKEPKISTQKQVPSFKNATKTITEKLVFNDRVEIVDSIATERTYASLKNKIIDDQLIFQKDSSNKELPKKFIYISSEDLLASAQTDSSIQLMETKTKEPNTFLESDALLVEMERQLFEERNQGVFKRAKRQLKKIRKAIASRNNQD